MASFTIKLIPLFPTPRKTYSEVAIKSLMPSPINELPHDNEELPTLEDESQGSYGETRLNESEQNVQSLKDSIEACDEEYKSSVFKKSFIKRKIKSIKHNQELKDNNIENLINEKIRLKEELIKLKPALALSELKNKSKEISELYSRIK